MGTIHGLSLGKIFSIYIENSEIIETIWRFIITTHAHHVPSAGVPENNLADIRKCGIAEVALSYGAPFSNTSDDSVYFFNLHVLGSNP